MAMPATVPDEPALHRALGLSDDEAYHWVLAHRPAFGYAFHPPGMAWMVFAAR